MKKPSHNGKVTIIAVAYNSLKVLPKMLSSISEETPIIIVDNASEDVNGLRLLTESYNANLVENSSNLGFGVACNIGAENANTEFLLFLNPDAMLDENSINILVDAATRYPNASAMNPRIVDEDGKPSFKRRSQLLPRSQWMERGWPSQDCNVSVLSGAALFVKAVDFRKVGGFDKNIFLFHEDDDLALRLAKECGPLMFIHSSVVTHLGGSSSTRSAKIAGIKAWHMGRSRVYAAQKHGIKFAKLNAIVEAALKAVSPEILFSKRRRVKNWKFLSGVISACFGNLIVKA